MRNDIAKLLGMQALWVDSWQIKRSGIIIKMRSPRTSARCPGCDKSSKKIHQYHQRTIQHSRWQSRSVILLLTKRRFYCLKCKKPFSEIIPGINRKRSTANFRNILLKAMTRQSLSYVTDTVGASNSTLYSVLNEHLNQGEIDWAKQGHDLILGIDEHSFRGHRMALTLTNITEKKLLAVGEDDSMVTVRKILEKADKSKISEVCMDMKAGYLNAVREILPDALVTVDKFHVIAAANQMLDEVRSIIVGKHFHVRKLLFRASEKLTEKDRLKLQGLFDRFKPFSSLYGAYMIKEKVRNMYRSKNHAEAKQNINYVIMLCQTSRSRYVQDYGKTLSRWKEYILNHFITGSTNAFTEGVHTKIKMIKRVSFGFRNINNYIAKVTLAFMPFLYLLRHTY